MIIFHRMANGSSAFCNSSFDNFIYWSTSWNGFTYKSSNRMDFTFWTSNSDNFYGFKWFHRYVVSIYFQAMYQYTNSSFSPILYFQPLCFSYPLPYLAPNAGTGIGYYIQIIIMLVGVMLWHFSLVFHILSQHFSCPKMPNQLKKEKLKTKLYWLESNQISTWKLFQILQVGLQEVILDLDIYKEKLRNPLVRY